jgi:hydrogenase maturation protease
MTRAHRFGVIGLGSDHGDDQLGHGVIEALRHCRLPAGTALHACSAPATELLPRLADCEHAIIVDALLDDGPPGRIVRCDPAQLAPRARRASSHGVSLETVLALAAALQMAPARLMLLGLTIDGSRLAPGDAMSPAVLAAIPDLVATVLAELDGSPVEWAR